MPKKTNWVMHQYHLGSNQEEKDGELVVSKVFYQTQPRHCLLLKLQPLHHHLHLHGVCVHNHENNNGFLDYYNSAFISFDQAGQQRSSHFPAHDDESTFT